MSSSIHSNNSLRISVLGSGWLGLPLALELQQLGHTIKVSTRSHERLQLLKSKDLEAQLYDIDSCDNDDHFLSSDILIINITSKNINAFTQLITKIEASTITNVLFISSTSVYADSFDVNAPAIAESDVHALKPCPLLTIENLFRDNQNFQSSIIRFAGLIGYQRHPGRFFLKQQDDGHLDCRAIKNPDGAVNMIHRDDCIGIIETIITNNNWGEVYNGCASDHPTRRAFYTAALQHLAYDASPVFVENEQQSYKKISNQKIKNSLQYLFKFDHLLDFESTPYDTNR